MITKKKKIPRRVLSRWSLLFIGESFEDSVINLKVLLSMILSVTVKHNDWNLKSSLTWKRMKSGNSTNQRITWEIAGNYLLGRKSQKMNLPQSQWINTFHATRKWLQGVKSLSTQCGNFALIFLSCRCCSWFSHSTNPTSKLSKKPNYIKLNRKKYH